MKKKSSEKITLANFIAIIGLVALAVFTFLGREYMSGGELGWDFLYAIGITTFASVLLWLLIKTKGAENDLGKWRVLEYSLLALYIIVVIPVSYLFIKNFFVVNENKLAVQQSAKADIAKIDKMFDDYKANESKAISQTITGLQNAYGQKRDAKLVEFFDNNHLSDMGKIDGYQTHCKTNILDQGDAIRNEFNKEKESILNAVNGWSVILIPMKSKRVEDLAQSIGTELTKVSSEKSELIPHINHESAEYSLGEEQKFEYKVNPEELQFRNKLASFSGFSIIGLAVVLLIHLFILFNYIVAYRTSTLGVNKNMDEDGGILLR